MYVKFVKYMNIGLFVDILLLKYLRFMCVVVLESIICFFLLKVNIYFWIRCEFILNVGDLLVVFEIWNFILCG